MSSSAAIAKLLLNQPTKTKVKQAGIIKHDSLSANLQQNACELEKNIKKDKIEQGLRRKYSDQVMEKKDNLDKENKMVWIMHAPINQMFLLN